MWLKIATFLVVVPLNIPLCTLHKFFPTQPLFEVCNSPYLETESTNQIPPFPSLCVCASVWEREKNKKPRNHPSWLKSFLFPSKIEPFVELVVQLFLHYFPGFFFKKSNLPQKLQVGHLLFVDVLVPLLSLYCPCFQTDHLIPFPFMNL